MTMDAARWQRIEALFHAALERPEPTRRAWLDAECGGDAALLADVLALLEQDARSVSPLDRGLARLAHELLDEPPADEAIGPYRILSVLGRGGMGVVYLGERADLRSRVAIKLLRDAGLSPARLQRFQREQRTLARLNHPSIARLYDADTLPDGTPYFVMEYVDGLPLTTYCELHGCSVHDRLRLFRSVCDAVQHAHRHAVIHRDLKPSNILVAPGAAGEPPTVKLLDFGIARHLEALDAEPGETQGGLRLLTVAYADPGQLRGEPPGVHTDVYSLGVVLHELLAGEHPFARPGLTPGQVEARVLEHEPEPPSLAARRTRPNAPATPGAATLGRRAWADLDAICRAAIHRDVQQRYASVEALVRDLERFRRGQPLEARPHTPAYRFGKFLRRHRRPVATAATAVVMLVLLAGVHANRLTEQRNRAQAEARKAEEVAEYLIDLFEAGDPFGGDPDSLNIRSLLAAGVARAEELDDEPSVQAQMFDVLGRVHTRLSDHARAAELLRRAVALRRGSDDPLALAGSLANLGSLYRYMAQFDSAEVALREALALRQRHLPPRHATLAQTLDELGIVLNSRGEYAEAESLYRLALRIRREIHAGPHADVAHTLNNLAVNQYDQGRYAAAEHYLREALAISLVTYGPDHPHTAADLANLGVQLDTRGNYEGADSMLTEALRITRLRLGNDHYDTAFRLMQRGAMLRRKGDLERARRDLTEALDIHNRLLDPNHRNTAVTLTHLALTLQDEGELEPADSLFRRAIAAFSHSVGERHAFTAIGRCHLAYLLHLRGRDDEAEAHFREALEILRAALPAGHDMIALNESKYGVLLTAQRRYREAESLLLRSHDALRAALGADHHETLLTAQRLVDLYDAWDRPDRADRYRTLLTAAAP